MEAFISAATVVALAEIGDKTQLLAFALAAKFRKPVPIVLGILAATLANHGLAAGLGVWITTLLPTVTLRWIVGLSFIAMAVWALIPDRSPETSPRRRSLGVFGTTLAAFFLAEMGDKTQIATAALAANHGVLGTIVVATTLGMMIANVPVVCLGEGIMRRVPLGPVRVATAVVFAVFGVAALSGIGGKLLVF